MPSAATVERADKSAESTTERDLADTSAESTTGWDLDIELVELLDPAKIVMMTDDNCGQTCEKTTCISAV